MGPKTDRHISGNGGNGLSRTELIRAISALMMPLVVAAIGIYGSTLLERKSTQDARTQLYTQLISQRESAETALRSDMFKSIIDRFLNREQSETLPLRDEILQLQLLALNFHESLALTPLFKYLEEDIEDEPIPREKKDEYLTVLYNLASDINSKQLAILNKGAVSVDIEYDFGEAASVTAEGSPEMFSDLWTFSLKEPREIQGGDGEDNFFWRSYRIAVHSIDTQRNEVGIYLSTATPVEEVIGPLKQSYSRKKRPETQPAGEVGNQEPPSPVMPVPAAAQFEDEDALRAEKIRKTMEIIQPKSNIETDWELEFPQDLSDTHEITENDFKVSYFDFPMVDHIRLPDGKNCAVILQNIVDENRARLTLITFSSQLSSFKERHYYEEVVKKLLPETR